MEKTVIVLGSTLTTLSTLRALKPLKREGYRIMLCSGAAADNIPFHSNIPDKKVVFREGVVDGLLQLSGAFRSKPILALSMDADVMEISKRRSELRPYYRFRLPAHEMVRTLMEKNRFQCFARDNGLEVPLTLNIQSPEELLRADTSIEYPIIVKPYLLHAKRVDKRQELERLADELQPLHYKAMVAQQYIEGGDDELYFCFLLIGRDGQLVRKMTARKLRQWPLSYGSTSLAVTVQDEGLDRAVNRFLEVARPAGYSSIEFKRDGHTGKYYIMEPTIGRFNQQISLSVASGVNIPLALVRLIAGEPVEPCRQRDQVYWVYESNDLLAWLKSGRQYGYLKNFLKPSAEVLFSVRDPRPLFAEMQFMALKKWRKLTRNV